MVHLTLLYHIYLHFAIKSKSFLTVQERLALVEATGLAPLAARPAKRLSIVCFAVKIALSKCRKAKHFAPAKWLPPSNPFAYALRKHKTDHPLVIGFVCERAVKRCINVGKNNKKVCKSVR